MQTLSTDRPRRRRTTGCRLVTARCASIWAGAGRWRGLPPRGLRAAGRDAGNRSRRTQCESAGDGATEPAGSRRRLSVAYSNGQSSAADSPSRFSELRQCGAAFASRWRAAARARSTTTTTSTISHQVTGVPAGMPARYDRHSVRVGLSFWLPLFGIVFRRFSSEPNLEEPLMLPKKKYTAADYAAIARRRLPLVDRAAACRPARRARSCRRRLPNVYEAEMLVQIVPQRVPDSLRGADGHDSDRRPARCAQPAGEEPHTARTDRSASSTCMDRSGPFSRCRTSSRSCARTSPSSSSGRRRQRAGRRVLLCSSTTGIPRWPRESPSVSAHYHRPERTRTRRSGRDGTNDFLRRSSLEAKERLEAQDQKLQQFRERNAGKLPTQAEYNMQAIQSTQMQRQASSSRWRAIATAS